MATKHSDQITSGDIPSGEGLKVGIVVSKWNHDITGSLLNGCRDTLVKSGVSEDDITVEYVPGSYELPMGARILSAAKKFDAIICLGCVIKGETKHDEYISQSVASGIMQLSIMMNVPIIFGVLTPNDHEQAVARAGGKLGNKGDEAAVAALEMATLKNTHNKNQHKIGFN